jgi:hypothetical protein
MRRKAACCCGAAVIEVEGDPTLNAICHCDNCKRRTGSAFGWSAYFPDERVVSIEGEFLQHRIRDEAARSFCAKCGTTLFWKSLLPEQTDVTGIAGGAFLDPPLPEPVASATDQKRVPWIELPESWVRMP